MSEDPYEILGVEPGAGLLAVKRAYQRLVRVHRPERDPAGFQRLREAYELLRTWETEAVEGTVECEGGSGEPDERDSSGPNPGADRLDTALAEAACGRFERAGALVEEALLADPDSSRARRALLLICEEEGDTARLQEAAGRALSGAEDEPIAAQLRVLADDGLLDIRDLGDGLRSRLEEQPRLLIALIESLDERLNAEERSQELASVIDSHSGAIERRDREALAILLQGLAARHLWARPRLAAYLVGRAADLDLDSHHLQDRTEELEFLVEASLEMEAMGEEALGRHASIGAREAIRDLVVGLGDGVQEPRAISGFRSRLGRDCRLGESLRGLDGVFPFLVEVLWRIARSPNAWFGSGADPDELPQEARRRRRDIDRFLLELEDLAATGFRDVRQVVLGLAAGVIVVGMAAIVARALSLWLLAPILVLVLVSPVRWFRSAVTRRNARLAGRVRRFIVEHRVPMRDLLDLIAENPRRHPDLHDRYDQLDGDLELALIGADFPGYRYLGASDPDD